jgi:hydrogenase maturation factor
MMIFGVALNTVTHLTTSLGFSLVITSFQNFAVLSTVLYHLSIQSMDRTAKNSREYRRLMRYERTPQEDAQRQQKGDWNNV